MCEIVKWDMCGGTFATSIKIHQKSNLDADACCLGNYMSAS